MSADPSSLFRECRQLLKAGDPDRADALLAGALRLNSLDADGVLHAGRLLGKIDNPGTSRDGLRVRIAGQCTTSWLVDALTAVARGRGQPVNVEDADYDNVLQDVAALDGDVDVLILLPWADRLLSQDGRKAGERVTDEVDFWRQVWSAAAEKPDLHIVQVGYDWLDTAAHGAFLGQFGDGAPALVSAVNQALREQLPAGAYFVDLSQVAGTLGRESMYDRRRYFWTRQPFSARGLVRLAEHLFAGIRAVVTGPKKVLVLDLDNTLWGGVVGETGALGVELGDSPAGEAFRDFQRLAKSLSERGILLAVCSKNNPEDAREPFEKNPDMILSLDDITAFEAGWSPKSEVIRAMADSLRLGLDSFVFFDDEPAERELVRQALPEVEVVDVPDDPADYRQALLRGLWFESVGLSEEDRKRTEHYRVEQQRQAGASGDVGEYLRSLEMTGSISEIGDGNMDRVVQLIGKTNQFNLTTRRHTREAVESMLAPTGSLGLALNVTDRFGDYGLVGVVIAVADPADPEASLHIDTWLMSCRVIGRTAEHFLFNQLLSTAADGGYRRLVGEFIPTAKNAVVADLYQRLGFEALTGSEDGQLFSLDVGNGKAANSYIDGTA